MVVVVVEPVATPGVDGAPQPAASIDNAAIATMTKGVGRRRERMSFASFRTSWNATSISVRMEPQVALRRTSQMVTAMRRTESARA